MPRKPAKSRSRFASSRDHSMVEIESKMLNYDEEMNPLPYVHQSS